MRACHTEPDVCKTFEWVKLAKEPVNLVPYLDDKLPPLFFGIGLMQYEKPYQLTIDDVTLDEALFDARFRGAGLAFGTTLGGGVNRFVFAVDAQAGLGQVSLTEDLEHPLQTLGMEQIAQMGHPVDLDVLGAL